MFLDFDPPPPPQTSTLLCPQAPTSVLGVEFFDAMDEMILTGGLESSSPCTSTPVTIFKISGFLSHI